MKPIFFRLGQVVKINNNYQIIKKRANILAKMIRFKSTFDKIFFKKVYFQLVSLASPPRGNQLYSDSHYSHSHLK